MGILVQHVQSHPKTGRLSFRRAFPPHLLPFIPAGPSGKAPVELKISLGTKDPTSTEFYKRYADGVARFDSIVAKATKAASGSYDALDAPRIAFLATALEIEFLRYDDETRWSRGRDGLELLKAGWDWNLPDFKQWRADGDWWEIENEWGNAAHRLVAAHGLVVDPADHEGFEALCRELNDAAIRAGEIAAQRMAGRSVPTPVSPQFAEAPPPADASSLPMLRMFDDYVAAKAVSPIVAQDWRRCIEKLIDFLGHDDASRVSVKDLMRWRDDLSVGGVRAAVTIRGKYIGSVKAMMTWAVKEHLLTENVAKSVSVSVKKRQRLRDPSFTTDEATRILSATLREGGGGLTEEQARARRWVPWLCAYTGARVNEMTQLRREDVREIDGYWTVRITPEAGTVKNGSARVVPLHPHLIEQGFVSMIDALDPGPAFYNPARQRVQSDTNRHVKKVGERLAAWVRKDVGVDDPEVQPNHGWRHRFKTEARRIRMDPEVRDAIQGHAPVSQGGDYGISPVDVMAEAIAMMPRYEIDGT